MLTTFKLIGNRMLIPTNRTQWVSGSAVIAASCVVFAAPAAASAAHRLSASPGAGLLGVKRQWGHGKLHPGSR